MHRGGEGSNTHEWFRELCALSVSGDLSPLESAELHSHLEGCESCRNLLAEYQVLATQGMSVLAESYGDEHDANWDSRAAGQRLLDRVRDLQDFVASGNPSVEQKAPARPGFVRTAAARAVPFALAAGLLLAVGHLGYLLGLRHSAKLTAAPANTSSTASAPQNPSSEKAAADPLVASQAKELSALQQLANEKDRELEKLREDLRAAQDRADLLGNASVQNDEKLRAALQERDALATQLQTASQNYDRDRTDLVRLRAERDGNLIHTNSLEARVSELTATNHEQEHRLKELEQYLSSDRDIRELMGARKLYIADVFDVDGSSQTQRPFGRVFYTQGKSLIFYAFDLDRQPKVVNSSAFQVWGQRETPQGQQAVPMNLGILYMDNEANRRWVMRFDDPKQLAEIDAVFVTVEPRGGSAKPTSKPFLYALLRNQANHP